MTNRTEQLHERANALRMYGLLAHWSEIAGASWVEPLLQWEEQERARRSLERRIRDARLGNFKPLTDCVTLRFDENLFERHLGDDGDAIARSAIDRKDAA